MRDPEKSKIIVGTCHARSPPTTGRTCAPRLLACGRFALAGAGAGAAAIGGSSSRASGSAGAGGCGAHVCWVGTGRTGAGQKVGRGQLPLRQGGAGLPRACLRSYSLSFCVRSRAWPWQWVWKYDPWCCMLARTSSNQTDSKGRRAEGYRLEEHE